MKILTAAQMRLESLYHYQKFNADRLVQTLSTQSIYCPNPSTFNDPWDCKPWFDKSVLTDSVSREKLIRWFDAIGRVHNPELPEAERRRRVDIMRRDKVFLERMVDECSASIAQVIDARYRVYCLTTDALSTLMWSHYADNHQGICLEFGVKNVVVCAAQKVEYRDVYPALRLDATDEYQNLLPILTKSEVWKYEDEYRLIAQDEAHAVHADTLKTTNNFLRLPLGALKAIVLGCGAPQATVGMVTEIIGKHSPGMQVKRAVRTPNRYALTIEVAPG